MSEQNKSNGFTLIELLVVTSIIIVFTGISASQFNLYTQQAKLRDSARKLSDVLELAKKKAISSDLFDKNCTNFSGYKVVVASGSYSLQFGCGLNYTVVNSYNLPTTNLSITSTLGNINFPPLMKNLKFHIAPNINSVQLKNSVINKCVNISISQSGLIELDETLIPC